MSAPARLRFFRTADAPRIAGELFRECFKADFPVPREGALPIPTPPENWRQFVGVYTWPDGREEAVAFCNWIKYGDAYIGGGMCSRESVYRRLPREEFRAIREQGGLAQMIQAHAWTELTDCKAWFGYCGDGKAMAVDLRFGYVPTRHPHLIVRWRDNATPDDALVDAVAAIGPF